MPEPDRARGFARESLPKYVAELQTLCSRHHVPCHVNRESRSVRLELPAGAQDYTGALTAIVSDIRTFTSWSVSW